MKEVVMKKKSQSTLSIGTPTPVKRLQIKFINKARVLRSMTAQTSQWMVMNLSVSMI